METLIVLLHVLAAAAIIVLVLLQHGKGADMGAAFGTGSAGSIFGSSGSANFLSRSTAFAAAAFFATSLVLTYVSAHRSGSGGALGGFMQGAEKVEKKADEKKVDAIPATPAPAVTAPAPAAGTPAAIPATPAPTPAASAPAPAVSTPAAVSAPAPAEAPKK